MTVAELLPTVIVSTRRCSSTSIRRFSSRRRSSPASRFLMLLPKFFLESADHVLNEFLAQHLVLQARQKAIFQLLTLDPQTVSANAIAALRMERASVLRS